MYGHLAFTGISVLAYGLVGLGSLAVGTAARIKAKRMARSQDTP